MFSFPKCLLKQSGASVSSDQVKEAIGWVLKYCPWFLKEGILNVEV
jgi:hypothetical protein